MQNWLSTSKLREHGAFMDGCARHCDFGEHAVEPLQMRVHNANPLQAFAAWYAALSDASNARTVWKQRGDYPCRTCCGNAAERASDEGGEA